MKQFATTLALIAALAASVLALLLAMDRDQEDNYISIYDTDENDLPL